MQHLNFLFLISVNNSFKTLFVSGGNSKGRNGKMKWGGGEKRETREGIQGERIKIKGHQRNNVET